MAIVITAEQLLELNRSLPGAGATLFASALSTAFDQADISTNRRVRHFIGQSMVETGRFHSLVESTRYTKPDQLDRLFQNVQGLDHARRLIEAGPVAIGNTIYANKLGNGGIESGDGFRFRGRGFLQVTGRDNYRRIGKLVGMPLEQQPELLEQAAPAALSAALFWKLQGINDPADADNVSAVTRIINGPARLHLKEREAAVQEASAIWPD